LVPDRIDTLRLRLPERTHLVFGGPLEAVEDIGWTAPGGSFMRESPSVVWPTDRAWFLAADVDQTSTYVGGTHRLAAALVAESELEA
jgi:hypothetical protein